MINSGRPPAILFVCLPSTLDVFKNSKIRLAVPLIPLISIAQLSAVARQAGYAPHVLDLSVPKQMPVKDRICRTLERLRPRYCGITFTTPLSDEADEIAAYVKSVDRAVATIAGGCHVALDPGGVLTSGHFDLAVYGEGEVTLRELLEGVPHEKIDGLAYRRKGIVTVNRPRDLIADLDTLPLPDYSVFDKNDYRTPRINCRKNPVAAIETSRGCVYGCVYCNKKVFQQKFRAKSPQRTVDEMEHILSFGYREIHIWDDGLSTDLERAKNICREIVARKLRLSWNVYNGLRVDRVDAEFFELLKKSGCYRISIGVESGNQDILNRIRKGTNVEQVRKAFYMAHKAGLETLPFCMIALPGETEETMRQTIDFILDVKPTVPKLSIMMPLPGTPIFDEWDKAGYIISKNWSDYVFHLPHKVYNHPNLDWDTINRYYNLFYRKTMLNPGFLWRRLLHDIKTGELPWDIYYFVRSLKWGW